MRCMTPLTTSLVPSTFHPLSVTEQQSLQVTKDIIFNAISTICYVRGLLPGWCFDNVKISRSLKVAQLKGNDKDIDADSQLLYDWIHKGAFDAINKKYLKNILFSIHSTKDDSILEDYNFDINYEQNSTRNILLTHENAMERMKQIIRNIVAVAQTFEGKNNEDNEDNEDNDDKEEKEHNYTCNNDSSHSSLFKSKRDYKFAMRFKYHGNCPIDYQPPMPMFPQCDSNDERKFKFSTKPHFASIGQLQTQFHSTKLYMKTLFHDRQ